MLEETMELIKRFVTAQERIADALATAGPKIAVQPSRVELPLNTAEEKKERTSATPGGPGTDPKEQRGWLKERLDELGVDYTSRMATATLQKKYDEEMARLEAAAKESEETKDNPEEDALDYTAMRDKLYAFAQSHGTDAAKKILNQLDASKLSSLDDSRYPELLELINAYTAKHPAIENV